MDADKDYDTVFHKDDRNQTGSKYGKKRTNVKEVRRRLNQIEKKKEGRPGSDDGEEVIEEIG